MHACGDASEISATLSMSVSQLTFKRKVRRRHRAGRIHHWSNGQANGDHYPAVHTMAQLVCEGAWCSYNQLRVRYDALSCGFGFCFYVGCLVLG